MDIIVVTGPTASGKTDLAIDIALKYNGEIVNADSMQVYKYMNIGTAKPTIEDRKGIKHYLIDEIDPRTNFSVSQYCELAHKYIKEIHEKGKLPILVGGTGLYVDSVVNNITFSEIPSDKQYCEYLSTLATINGNEYIYKKLQTIDKDISEKISVNDKKRIIRALEVFHTTGKTMTWHRLNSLKNPSPYEAKFYAILHDREKLYERINIRVDKMFDMGLVDEVKGLINMGVLKDSTAMQAIGYKEVVLYLDNQISLNSCIELIKKNSRHYAKRQLTWFRANKNIKWLDNNDWSVLHE